MATTWPTVYARITSLTADLGYTLAAEPFSFDLQPDTRLDAVCRVEAELDGYDGYLGGDQEERWNATVWIAATRKRNPHGAYQDMLVRVDSLTAGVMADETAGDYHLGDEVQVEIAQPAADAGFLVGQITLPIVIERTV